MTRRWMFVALWLAAAAWLLAGLPYQAAAAPLLSITETPSPTPRPTNTVMPTSTVPPTSTPPPTSIAPPTSTPPPADTPAPVAADPLLTKGVDLQNAQVGDPVIFTLTASNPHGVDIPQVTVVDPLPPEVDFVDTAASQGAFAYDAATHTLTYNLGALPAGQSATMIIRTRVNSLGQPGNPIRNLATANGRAPSNPVDVLIIPGSLPAAGEPPALWALALAVGLTLAGGVSVVLSRAGRRRKRR